ncbi:MAG: hypothetical protein ABSB40_11205 [Nitrososphaeria archaeon]|jgi:predicted transcriptional regulator
MSNKDDDVWKEMAIMGRHRSLIEQLTKTKEMHMSELARALGVKLPAISEAVKELKGSDLIEVREESQKIGGPRKYCSLSERGRKIVDALMMTEEQPAIKEMIPVQEEVAEWLKILQECNGKGSSLPTENYELYTVMLYRLDKLATSNPEACYLLVDEILEGIGEQLRREHEQLFNILKKLAAKDEILKRLKEEKYVEKFRLLASKWVEAAAKDPISDDVRFTIETYSKLLSLLNTISGKEGDEFMLDQFDKLRGVVFQGVQVPYIPLKYIDDRTWLFKHLIEMLANERDKQKKNLLCELVTNFESHVKG